MFREKNIRHLKGIILAAALTVVPVLAFAVTPPPAAILSTGSATIVSGDTNNNGYPENNVDVRFKVLLTNSAYSLNKVFGATVTLATSDANISITDNLISFGDVDVGVSKGVSDDFGFRVLNNFAGAASFTIRISYKDSSGVSYSLPELIPISINIERPNTNPPVLGVIGNKSVNEGQALQFTLSATDADANPLTCSASGLPSGATFNASTKVFSWVPNYTQAGTYNNITFTVSDGLYTDSETISITVNNINRPPDLAAIGNKTVNEGQLLQFAISATDPDGTALTYSVANLPSGATFNAATKTFSWTPTYTQSGTYPNITFTVSDGSLTDSEAITITVNNVNRAPDLAPIGNKTVDENQILQFSVSAVDPDNDPLTYSVSNLPSGATFNATTKTFSWTPSYTQAGNYINVTFTASDGTLTDSEAITITVNNVNRAPDLAAIGNKTVNENQLLQFAISATDPDGTALTYSVANLPSGATFNAATKTFSWTPTYYQAGVYSNITFAVSDGSLTDSETISITVNNVNGPPDLAPIGNKSVNENQLLQFSVSAVDPDNDPITYSVSNLPFGATFNAATKTFSWTPSYTQAGTYNNIVFKVSAGAHTDYETISITVNNVNRAPKLNLIGSKTVKENSLLQFAILASDPDGEPLSYSASNLPAGATFTPATRTFRWVPTYEQSGTYIVTLAVSDGGLSDSEAFTITVYNVAQPPQVISLSPSSGASLAGTPVNFTTVFYDPDGWQDLNSTFIIINSSFLQANGFYAYYDQDNNKLYLRNNSDSAWLGGYAPGSATVIENSFAILDCSKTTVFGSGNNLTINWNVNFKPAFIGNKYIYLKARDDSGQNTLWVKKGFWRVN